MSRKKETVETIKDKIEKAIDGHLTPEYIEKRVHEIINKNVNDVILKLLGFDNRWMSNGTYEVDHCNGRSGESFVGDYIRSQASEKLKQWADNTNISEVKLPKSAIQDMEREFVSIYTRKLRESLSNRATYLAQQAAEEYLKDLISEVPSINDVINENPSVKKQIIPNSEKPKVVGLEL